MCLFHSESNHFRIIVKSGNKYRACKIHNNSHYLCHRNTAEDTNTCSFFCPVIFLCAQILTDKCGQPHRKTGNRQKTKSLNLGICPASSNSQLAEAVDIRLHYHVCNGDHGVLDAGRKTVGYDLFQHIGVQANIPKGNRILLRAFFHQTVQTQKCTHKLGNDSGKSCALHAHSKSAYKNLGKNVSHGCVRVLPHVAQWIYYNCPPGTLCNIVKNKAANPYLVSRLKSTIPDYSSYQQPSDSHATPSEVPATVKLNDVPVRSGFSNSKDKTVAKLNYGDHVELLQIGAEWCKVRTPAGKLGYVKTMYLTCDPDNVRTTQSYAATGKTYIYSSASRSSSTLTTIPKGKTVNVTEQAGSGWLYGSYNGVSGYMRTKYVKLTDTLLYPNPDGSYPDGTSVAAAPQSQTQTQTGTGSASAPSSGARVKSGIIANFRSGPGSEYGVIAELEPGTPVKIISVAGNWYFCEVNGLQGYLHPSCVVGF